MDLSQMWFEIKKDIINKENEDKVRELLELINTDLIEVDEEGNSLGENVDKVLSGLIDIGETKIAENWV